MELLGLILSGQPALSNPRLGCMTIPTSRVIELSCHNYTHPLNQFCHHQMLVSPLAGHQLSTEWAITETVM